MVHIEPVGNGKAALKYLAPYIFRVAISNNNILDLKEGKVTFRYKDSETKLWRVRIIPAEEFIHRFLQHVLPYKFIKVRYYGFLSANKRKQLENVKELSGQKYIPIKANTIKPDNNKNQTLRCPKCGNLLTWVKQLPRKRGPPW